MFLHLVMGTDRRRDRWISAPPYKKRVAGKWFNAGTLKTRTGEMVNEMRREK
jgi:hypothetical protein